MVMIALEAPDLVIAMTRVKGFLDYYGSIMNVFLLYFSIFKANIFSRYRLISKVCEKFMLFL